MGDHPIISENREENQMLVPAILFKDQITSEFQRIYYTEDMMYLTGCLEQWSPDISTNPEVSFYKMERNDYIAEKEKSINITLEKFMRLNA